MKEETPIERRLEDDPFEKRRTADYAGADAACEKESPYPWCTRTYTVCILLYRRVCSSDSIFPLHRNCMYLWAVAIHFSTTHRALSLKFIFPYDISISLLRLIALSRSMRHSILYYSRRSNILIIIFFWSIIVGRKKERSFSETCLFSIRKFWNCIVSDGCN